MFQQFPIEQGSLVDRSSTKFPYVVRGVSRASMTLESGQSHVGMVAAGRISVADGSGDFELGPGMFFSVEEATVTPRTPMAQAMIVSGPFFQAFRQFGGPVESAGRLRYVDGCTDTLLICPPRTGDPCLNHLHIPAHVPQRRHYHPSDRVGIIFQGSGVCHTDEGDFELSPGAGWFIPAGLNHSFETTAQPLDVIVWHPDSDFGPSDENHPMINRTWVR